MMKRPLPEDMIWKYFIQVSTRAPLKQQQQQQQQQQQLGLGARSGREHGRARSSTWGAGGGGRGRVGQGNGLAAWRACDRAKESGAGRGWVMCRA